MEVKKSKILIIVVCLLVILSLVPNNVFAAGSFSVSSSATSATVGTNVTLTITTNSCAGKFSVVSSNTNVATVSSGSTFVDGSASITISTKGAGTANITVTAVDVSDSDLNDVKGSKSVCITVKEKEAPKPNNNNDKPNTNTNTNTKPNTTNTLSSNSFLSKLQVNVEGLSPNFNKNKTSYTLNVGSEVNDISVTAVAESSKAKVAISGNTGLKNGDNNVYVTVTAQNGAKRTYIIVVTKTANPDDSNSYLENLIVENATLSPKFSKEIFEYDCGSVGSDVERLKILSFPEIEEAKVEVTGNDELIEGENNVVIKITSKDGSTSKEYKIKVIKEANAVETAAMVDTNSDEQVTQNTNGNGFFSNLWYAINANALIVIMYVLIVVEFVEIVYLYCKLNNIVLFRKKRDNHSKYNIDISDIEEKKETKFKVINKDENDEKLDKNKGSKTRSGRNSNPKDDE